MPSINLDNLERYDSKARNEAEEEYMPKDSGNWQKTEEAGAVAFYPVPNTPLEGKVKFSFTETPPAEGDKSPSNPSTITGVSSVNVVRCNKNIFFGDITQPSHGNVTLTKHNDGSVTVSGVNENASFLDLMPRNTLKLGLAYTLSGCPSGGGNSTYVLRFGDDYYSYDSGSGKTITIGATGDVDTSTVMLKLAAGCDATNVVFYPQVELGTEKTSFEKGEGDTYTISLGSTYYGGTLDVASGVMTVNYASYTFGGNTGFSSSAGVSEFTNLYRLAIYPTPARSTKDIHASCACNTFPVVSTNSDSSSCIRLGNNSSKIEVDLRKDLLNLGDGADFNTVKTAFNSFFSSYPATVVYVVSTPQTVQLTPTEILSLTQTDKCTPRLNTVYTDADTIQIGYMKSPQRTEQEITQALLEIESNGSD